MFFTLDGIDSAQEAMKLEDQHRVIVLRPEGLPSDAYEIGEGITERLICVKGYVKPSHYPEEI